jgi:flagellar biosynthesis/type III secretory pathway chaperone
MNNRIPMNHSEQNTKHTNERYGMEMTEMFYSELFGLLSQELQILESVLDLATQQQQALIRFDSDGIEHMVNRHGEYVQQIAVHEQQRLRLLSATFHLSMEQARAMNLRDLARLVDAAHAQEMLRYRESMNSLSEKIQFVNSVNRVLALRGRNSIRETLDHVRSRNAHVVNASL